ncbi:Uncharacterised protein [[Clostridium] sordellii]|nr:Uncharacterised protein [[Clostridium] sordellii] [Paeniclostridium sordellii]
MSKSLSSLSETLTFNIDISNFWPTSIIKSSFAVITGASFLVSSLISDFSFDTLDNIVIDSALVILFVGLRSPKSFPFKYPCSIAPSTYGLAQLETLFLSGYLFNLS